MVVESFNDQISLSYSLCWSQTPEQEDVLEEDARVQCIQRTVCLENRKLSKAFGATGKILAKYLTWVPEHDDIASRPVSSGVEI